MKIFIIKFKYRDCEFGEQEDIHYKAYVSKEEAELELKRIEYCIKSDFYKTLKELYIKELTLIE